MINKVVTCPNCKGDGNRNTEKEGIYTESLCISCDGTGIIAIQDVITAKESNKSDGEQLLCEVPGKQMELQLKLNG